MIFAIRSYTADMTQPFLIFIDGPMGSGKTTTTKLLNAHLPDTARVAFPDIKRLIPNYKENQKTIPIIKEVMLAMIGTYLKHGVSVIVEQVTKVEGIQQLQACADQHGASCFLFRMQAPKTVRWQRVVERTREMMNVAEMPDTKLKELEAYFEPNHVFYEANPSPTSIAIDSHLNDPEKVIEIINTLVSNA